MGRAEDLFSRIKEHKESAIDELIRDRQSEELFLDFKRSRDNGAGSGLARDDRRNLAKAISGFGNSEGGIIIWGVDCRESSRGSVPLGDVPVGKEPLEDPVRFRSWLEGATSGCTIPPHSGVVHEPIKTSARRGFVVTLVISLK